MGSVCWISVELPLREPWQEQGMPQGMLSTAWALQERQEEGKGKPGLDGATAQEGLGGQGLKSHLEPSGRDTSHHP